MRTTGMLFCVGLVFMFAGCGSVRKVSPVDQESGEVLTGAKVKKNGKTIGKGETNVPLEQSTERVMIDPKPRWHQTTIEISETSPDVVTVDVPRNHFYRNTKKDTDNITNNWITIVVSPDQKADDKWWAKVINAITTGEFELQDYDKSSGFLRTAWKTRSWDVLDVRSRFRGTINTKEPLKWQIRYELQKKHRETNRWTDVDDRIFPEDLDVLKKIRNQIEK